MHSSSSASIGPARTDVLIMGGGLAGLTLAIQLKQQRPQLRVVVAEKRAHPVPEAAHKVGESTVEMGSHYYQNVIDQKAHLDAEQLPKMGVRFFAPAEGNRDITKRVELGFRDWPSLRSYQLDRGRFENHLAEEAMRLGAEFIDECRITRFELGPDEHSATLAKGDKTQEVRAKWLVDAAGRQALLRRRLGLHMDINHDVNAAWFRLADHIKIDEWPATDEWRSLVPTPSRWLSTVHLCGPGYWTWLIPLGSGSISIGVVADPNYVPFERIRRFEPCVEWLEENEPQCAAEVVARRHLLQDFKTLKKYAYGCKQVYSTDRWFLTGEAGPFLDPLYSPGSDFIGLGNTQITEIITRAEAGDDTAHTLVKPYNDLFLGYFAATKRLFAGQYGILGHPHVLPAKVVWDTAIYLMVPTMLFAHGKWTDLEFLASLEDVLVRQGLVGNRAQRFLRQWSEAETDISHVGYPRIRFDTVKQIYSDLIEPATTDQVRGKITHYVSVLEALYDDMVATVGGAAGFAKPTSANGAGPRRELLDDFGIFWAERPSPTPEREAAAAMTSVG